MKRDFTYFSTHRDSLNIVKNPIFDTFDRFWRFERQDLDDRWQSSVECIASINIPAIRCVFLYTVSPVSYRVMFVNTLLLSRRFIILFDSLVRYDIPFPTHDSLITIHSSIRFTGWYIKLQELFTTISQIFQFHPNSSKSHV